MFMIPGDVGGSEILLTNLASALCDLGVDLVIFGVRGFAAVHPRLASRAEVIEMPWSKGAQGPRIIAETLWLDGAARRRKIDLLHHGGGTSPLLGRVPSVFTLHDAQYVHYPQNFRRLKRTWLRFIVPRSLDKADRVSVPSEWVSNDIVRVFNIETSRVDVVPFGSENLFGDDPSSPYEVRSKYRLDKPFFIFPGRTYPHKNHRFLIEAFAPIADAADLVLTGAPWPRDADIQTAVRSLGITDSVRQLSLVPRRDLAGLYQAAAGLVYPTRFEGFGAPILEAMSMGCPVMASNITCIPEIVGEAGILLDPDDKASWTEIMDRLLTDTEFATNLSSLGKTRALDFTWERSARLQFDGYLKALDR
ncbi:MAG: glycosyltransferase family 4 protein [Actinobacteria bacterium]|nr:glycosyltransferase family 4 protein [Actinomycetota bacterium]